MIRNCYNLQGQMWLTATPIVSGGAPERTYYQYDGNGDRSRKVTYWVTATVDPAKLKSQRVYLDDYEVFIGYDPDGSTIHAHTHSQHISSPKEQDKPLERFAMVDTDPLTNAVTIQQFLSDHLGSASLTIYNGNRVAYEEYHPFGTSSYRTGSMPLRYRYCGKERDEESGLYYYGMRYYIPWLCRFVSVDPLKDKFINLTSFQYSSNNPTSAIDFDGLEALFVTDLQTMMKTVTNSREQGNTRTTLTHTFGSKSITESISKFGLGEKFIKERLKSNDFLDKAQIFLKDPSSFITKNAALGMEKMSNDKKISLPFDGGSSFLSAARQMQMNIKIPTEKYGSANSNKYGHENTFLYVIMSASGAAMFGKEATK